MISFVFIACTLFCSLNVSAEYSEQFLVKANNSLALLREKCMYTWLYENPWRPISFPKEYVFPLDAKSHLDELNAVVQPYRGIRPHSYAGYSGPWIENIWIQRYSTASIETFGGIIPLFVNWVDSQLEGKLDQIIKDLEKVLRPNVLYITVSQSDEGIHNFQYLHPNVLVLSAGGFGHVPIPLIKGEVQYQPPPQTFTHEVSFIGSDRDERHLILTRALTFAKAVGFNTANRLTSDWKAHIYGTKFNLSPRGYGRSSFRLAEVIQMGRIPIQLYNDVNWLPYMGTNMSLEHYGFQAGWDDVERLMKRLKSLSSQEVDSIFAKVKEVREYYTYDGVMKQIGAFMQDPLGANGGYLRCTPVPRTVVCCGR
jgi:hypothetical protein